MADHTFQQCDGCGRWVDEQPGGFLIRLSVTPAHADADATQLAPFLRSIGARAVPRVDLCAVCAGAATAGAAPIRDADAPAPTPAAVADAPPAASTTAVTPPDASPPAAEFSVTTLVPAGAPLPDDDAPADDDVASGATPPDAIA